MLLSDGSSVVAVCPCSEVSMVTELKPFNCCQDSNRWSQSQKESNWERQAINNWTFLTSQQSMSTCFFFFNKHLIICKSTGVCGHISVLEVLWLWHDNTLYLSRFWLIYSHCTHTFDENCTFCIKQVPPFLGTADDAQRKHQVFVRFSLAE